MTTQKEYEQLCEDIWHHNKLYYVDHSPIISDQEFDHLLNHLKKIEEQYPEWITPDSPTQRVGESLTQGFNTVEHLTPMLSLANSYSREEIDDFIKRVEKLAGHEKSAFHAELKMDGIAISALFEKGKFVRGLTRGDGKKGDDITHNMRTISALPLKLYGKNIPDILEVRGEVFMSHSAFLALNERKRDAEEALWANPRNAAAGSLKLLNPEEAAERGLSIVFYGIAEESTFQPETQTEIFPYLKTLGLPILEMHQHCLNSDEIWTFAEKVRKKRPHLNYDIDGVVIKVDKIKEQKRLGTTGKHPRWAVAYKFAAEQATTRILDITVQVGRTGVLTPVAELEPVFLAGSTISRSTLHNEEEIKRKDIRIGDIVTIEKGGDVIPKVVSVDTSQRSSTSKPWHMPTHCPICHTPIERLPDEVAIRCPNDMGCPEQQLRKIIYFAGRNAMDIEHLGEKVAQSLYEKQLIHTPSDLFTLTSKELSQLPSFKEKSIQNLLSSLEKAKSIPLSRFIMALGIKHVGSETAEMLAIRAGNIETLLAMNIEELQKIEGIGEKVATAIVDFFKVDANTTEVMKLLALGVNPQPVARVTFSNHPFQDKTFVITGTLDSYTRPDAAKLIKERGGKVTDSVSKKTDYILAGKEPGSKLQKGIDLGIKILDEQEFLKML